jgi:chemotaxis protein methyltransferase CheR
MSNLDLSPAVFSILSGLIEEKVGLHYGLLDRDVLQEKASARAVEAGFESLLDYYYYLRYDDLSNQELRELTENLVVNETYFFREWTAIQVLVDSVIAPMCARGEKVRVWSAACATGEEPLSLAMLLRERGILDQVEIVATDISGKALAKAREGRYGRRSVRRVPDATLLEKYIREEQDGFTVDRSLSDHIRWEARNLMDDAEIAALGKFDVVLCRNVLIYFSDSTVSEVLQRISRALEDGGILVVGVSESLLRYGGAFVGEERGGAFVYRKGAGP